MDERRTAMRERVIYGATAGSISGRTWPCVVRNFNDLGVQVVFDTPASLPDDIALTISRKGRSYQARVVWWRDNAAGIAFISDSSPSSDLEERLRIAEKQTRLLKRRVRELAGED